MGGLGIINPGEMSQAEFTNSKLLTENLTKLIEDQKHLITLDSENKNQFLKQSAN